MMALILEQPTEPQTPKRTWILPSSKGNLGSKVDNWSFFNVMLGPGTLLLPTTGALLLLLMVLEEGGPLIGEADPLFKELDLAENPNGVSAILTEEVSLLILGSPVEALLLLDLTPP
ncbi:hypothetical protein WICPIJ_002376 [Wickerhamomyces pijperi]|uniref:Uncharacterized protein n=1 Tax=Wickerhamomyces pijperi TaxID=599730 RepID=A0A9P8TPP5_WICPI|nr:hypothetical protein WICPIJ_002376 [Wickerhamomyces pijperi]